MKLHDIKNQHHNENAGQVKKHMCTTKLNFLLL